MEEILDSIRRIIADEEPAKGATETPQGSAADSPPPWPAAPPPQMAPRPMTPPRMTPAPAAASSAPLRDEEINSMLSQLRGASRQAPPASEEPASTEQSRERPSGFAPGAPPRAIDEHGLLSAATTAAVGAAFDTLAQTAQARNGRTIEELVSELIRPMLKTWLDDNLPEMVERLVRAEIERLSRAKG
jgi:cell pole-organizing protein PopZ